jgi:hypothetical protein
MQMAEKNEYDEELEYIIIVSYPDDERGSLTERTQWHVSHQYTYI